MIRCTPIFIAKSTFFALWKSQFRDQLKQMHDQALELGYPKIDDFGDFCLHIFNFCPDIIKYTDQ